MVRLLVIVTPGFNLSATMAFIDPFRAVNYLEGAQRFRWILAATGKTCLASNGVSVDTAELEACTGDTFDIVVVSSSWTPENAATPPLLTALRKWARQGSVMGALDTGAFILANAGLLKGRAATVHYEHIDALKELHPGIDVTEDIFVQDEKGFSCCGGMASADVALHLIAAHLGEAVASAAARYVFQPSLRPGNTSQNPTGSDPMGRNVPDSVKRAIRIMEANLEEAVSVAEICAQMKMSQRQLDRLFQRYVGRSPVIYYRDIRLDRARGLVTQTDMRLAEVALASGFASPVHFSRAYRDRFGVPPRKDRIEGRIPFEYRAWPMYRGVRT